MAQYKVLFVPALLYIILTIGFNYESKKSKNILIDLFEAEIVENQEKYDNSGYSK